MDKDSSEVEDVESDSHLYFNIDGEKFHKRHLAKLFNENKISSDRIQRITDTQRKANQTSNSSIPQNQILSIGDIVRVKQADAYWMIIRIIILSENSRDIYSSSFEELHTKLPKIYGILLKPKDLSKSLFTFKRTYKLLNLENIIHKINFHLEKDGIFIQSNYRSNGKQ
jgi:hypothetical protein